MKKLTTSHKEQIDRKIDRMYKDLLRLELVQLNYDTCLDPEIIKEARKAISDLSYLINVTEVQDNV